MKRGIVMKKAICSVIALRLIFACLCGCQNAFSEKLIVGEWTVKTNILGSGVVTETTYTFNEDKTGSISGVLGLDIATTYTIDDTHLVIVTDTALLKQTFNYTYEFDGDKLILVDTDGTQTVLTKVR